ncbi:MAG: hypothetical protein E7379_04205 [Clostridiales bacterium]|nr:hypothetical protein [Clostridiales bacterium]
MEHLCYNVKTGEIFKGEFQQKQEFDNKGKWVDNGWRKAVLYNLEELKTVGVPDMSGAGMALLRVKDGSIKPIEKGFCKEKVEQSRRSAWFGKSVVLDNKQKGVYEILNLETGKIAEEKELYGVDDVRLFDCDYYAIFQNDWNAFDEIGAIDESVDSLKREGIVVLRSSKVMSPEYRDGKFEGVRIGGKKVTKEELDVIYLKKLAQESLKKMVSDLIACGISKDEVIKIVESVEDNNEKDREL